MRNYSVGKGKEKVWKFKGSIFVTFKNPEAATAFVENKEWKYKDKDMIIKFQKNYLEDKQKEYDEKKKNKSQGNKKREDKVKEENLRLKSENTVLGQYIENLMQASQVFQAVSPKSRR